VRGLSGNRGKVLVAVVSAALVGIPAVAAHATVDHCPAGVAEVFLDNLQRWCAGQPLRNVVDKAVGYVR